MNDLTPETLQDLENDMMAPREGWFRKKLRAHVAEWRADRAALAEAQRRLNAIAQKAARVHLEYGIVGDWDGAYDWEDEHSAPANYAALPVPTEDDEPCLACGQIDRGQTGEHPCGVCGLPMQWDAALAPRAEAKSDEPI